MEGLEHQAVAAEGDDHIGLLRRYGRIARLKAPQRRLGLFRVGGDQGEGRLVHGPVAA